MASRKMQLNLNIEELPNIKKRIDDLTAERDAAAARAEAAEQAVQRVRDLHRPDIFQPAHCDQCAVPYPCVTIRALDETP